MKILKFTKLKNNKYKLLLANNDELILYDDVILKFNLLNSKDIASKDYSKIINYQNELLSYYRSIKYLSLKMRSEKEIEKYLKKLNIPEEIIIKTIKRLKKEGYLNELQYIHYYITDQLNLTLKGPLKIKKELLDLGIKEEDINKELSTINMDIWQTKALKIIAKKLKINKDSKQIFKRKIKEYLYKEGYTDKYYQLNDLKINDDDNFIKIANLIYNKLKRKYSDEKLIFYLKQKLYNKGFSQEQINDYIVKIK